MREAVAARLTRGKVDCRITFTPLTATARALTPDAEALGALHAATHLVLQRFPDARPLSISEVLHWPGVLAQESLSADEVKEQVLALVERAITELNQSRAREGASWRAAARAAGRHAVLVKDRSRFIPAR